uniref:Uncharacterized protein n=1 Tax=Arundo donax TaxID=35708 RepID=A0A0A9CD39_ARUDO
MNWRGWTHAARSQAAKAASHTEHENNVSEQSKRPVLHTNYSRLQHWQRNALASRSE